MNVTQAVAARRSVRGFLDTPVEPVLLERLAHQAARAPSGGNLQPWHIDILTGESLAQLKAIIAEKQAAGMMEAAAYDIYPRELTTPYKDRRFQVGMALYAAMGIERSDADARNREFRRNFQFFGAPAALFCTVDRRMGPPQWSDLGMYLQSFMLLAVEAGLATCAQECWAMYPDTVSGFLGTPAARMLFCGMAIGYADESIPANRLRADRAPAGEWLTLRG
ncbi:nitroreductase [Sphingomonas sp. 28-63-12]|uniref:nitroreductase n=1 Tax=Sphingomonas sp. 28-63-12 TaxID=1970434 RepID=UPI000BD81446|nr:MAG: nitroreductase family protein [Sphingomonas sp. 28-63-12]